MAFKVFSPGVLTSSDVNTFVMRQAVITCTSSTRPASPSEGMTIYETDTDRYRTYSGSAWENLADSGAWRSYTPSFGVDGAGTAWALGNGTVDAKYMRIGRMVTVSLSVVWGSTTTFGTGALMIGVPSGLTFASSFVGSHAIGTGRVNDISLGNGYPAGVYRSSNVGAVVLSLNATSLSWTTTESITSTRPVTWVSGDKLTALFSYETDAV